MSLRLVYLILSPIIVNSWLFSGSEDAPVIMDTSAFLPEALEQAPRAYINGEIIGVPISKQSEFAARTFACFPESKDKLIIENSKVNDDFCDCPNGRDEPSTSACSHIEDSPGFYCSNIGYKSVFISNSKVKDGICDCCDGSDEKPGFCENKCEGLGIEYRKQKEDRQKAIELGIRAKQDYIIKGKQGMDKLFKEAESAQVELDEVAEELVLLETMLEYQESIVREEDVVFDGESAEAQISSLNLNVLNREQIEYMLVELADVSGLGLKLERMVNKELDSESGAEDGAHWLSAPELVEYIKHMDQDEEGEGEEDEPCESDECPEGSADSPDIPVDEVIMTPSQVKSLKKEVETLRKKKRELEASVETTRKEIDFDFGHDNVLLQLKDKCFEKKVGKYTYKACLYKDAKQDSTRLGKFDSFDRETNQMNFRNGARCHVGVNREMTLNLKCGDKEELGEVKEPSICHYQAEFYTPAAC